MISEVKNIFCCSSFLWRFSRHGFGVGVVKEKVLPSVGANLAGGGGIHKDLTYTEIYTP